MRGIFLSMGKLTVVLICLIMALITLKGENTGLDEAQARLVSKMMENERIAEVFSMNDEGVAT